MNYNNCTSLLNMFVRLIQTQVKTFTYLPPARLLNTHSCWKRIRVSRQKFWIMQSLDITRDTWANMLLFYEKVFRDHNTVWVSCLWNAIETSLLFYTSIETFHFWFKNLAKERWICLNWGIGSAIHAFWACIQKVKGERRKERVWLNVILFDEQAIIYL